MEVLGESLDDLNSRYASAMLPITIVFGVFAVVGVCGNVIVIVVFSLGHVYEKSNFQVFVICLGIIDLLASALVIPFEVIKQRHWFSFNSVPMCKAKGFFNVWATAAGALCLFVVCVDRYRKVCQPFKRQISLSLAVGFCVILCVFISVFLAVPFSVLCGVRETNMTNVHTTNTNVYVCWLDDKYALYLQYVIALVILFIVLLGCVFLCEVGMYICIWRQLRKRWTAKPNKAVKHKNSSNQSFDSIDKLRTERNLVEKTTIQGQELWKRKFPYKTLIWLIVTVVFMATYILFAVMTVIVPSRTGLDPQSLATFEGFYRLYFINNIINPFLYTAFDKKFRDACRRICRLV